MNRLRAGFTLVEMMVIAPIVILLIGSFVALLVNLTGEVMSSRGSNVLAYDVQDALNRIEQDVKLSTTYLSTTNIDIDGDSTANPVVPATKQGFGGTPTTGSTVKFTNITKSGGSNASLILNALATNDNPLSDTANYVYLANAPNTCDTVAEYSKNTPMSMNIVYFVDNNDTLWRRTIMPHNYNTASARCGTAAPWQQPSCTPGYVAASLPFCKTNDIKLVEGVRPVDFQISYYTSAGSTAASGAANNPTDTTPAGDAVRNAALQSSPTVSVSIIARKTIAGREISQSGTVRTTRLDTNASSIAVQAPVTAAPTVPRISSNVSDGHYVNFTWPRVDGATSYDLEYRINGGAWQVETEATNMDNNSRKFTVSDGWHEDTVEVRVRATNSFGDSAWGSNSLKIPLWAPLILRGGWTDYAAGYGTAAYTKTKSGLVMLKGLVRHSGSPAIGDIIGVLPNDYKPSGRLLMGTSTAPNTSARVDINPIADGAQVVFSDSGNPAWFSLDSVRFVPAATPNAKVTPTLQNGFVAYGAPYEGPTYTRDTTSGTNRVTLQGLLNGGTRTNGTPIFTIPTALMPAKYQHHASRSGAFHHLGIENNTGLLAKGDGSGAYAINASYLPASVTGWVNLSMVNGWVYYPDGPNWFSTPQYVKTSDGIVQLKGLIRGGSTTYDSNIATLPAGFRPKGRILTTVPNSGGYARIDILANGEIHFMGSSNTWYALDSVYFMAEQ